MRSLDAQKTQIAAMDDSLLAVGLTGPLMAADGVDDVLDVISHMHQVEVDVIDLVLTKHRGPQPVDQSTPVRAAEQDHRERRHLAGLHQGQRLEQLVHGAKATRQDDERLCVLHEHRLAREEVAEVQPDVDVVVEVLLEGQLDAETDRDAARLATALVDRLHDPWPTTGDDSEAGAGESSADL